MSIFHSIRSVYFILIIASDLIAPWSANGSSPSVKRTDITPSKDYYQLNSRGAMIVVNTWNFVHANSVAWYQLINNKSALDAVEKGCSQCEIDQCDGTVGWGGSPAENGETTLDALIMDGTNFNIGAVAGLRRIKSAISVARKIMEHTNHTMLVGDLATDFALKMGFKEENLTSQESSLIWTNWKKNNCQPNFWRNVKPDPHSSCGPYKPTDLRPDDMVEYSSVNIISHHTSSDSLKPGHDTIGMIAIDSQGKIAAGTSTNGLRYKIPGRVGDSPIPGAGAYVDSEVGGAAATGDGDVMMRFLLSYQAVENLRNGLSPVEASNDVIRRLMSKTSRPYPMAAVIVVSINGTHGASCCGMDVFPRVVSDFRGSYKVVTKCLGM